MQFRLGCLGAIVRQPVSGALAGSPAEGKDTKEKAEERNLDYDLRTPHGMIEAAISIPVSMG
jgi:hypothetical protein